MSEDAGAFWIPDELAFTEPAADTFEDELMAAMTEALNDDFEPCCELFGKMLHHHWGRTKPPTH
jgi:hypothetical protein